MKRIITVLSIIILGCICSVSSVKASETTEGIAINEKNFPDQNVRRQLCAWVDKNGDCVLQPSEIKEAKWFGVSGWDDDTQDGKEYTTIDCTGLECLENLEHIYIAAGGMEPKEKKILNFNKLYQLKKLKKIDIEGSAINDTYDFSKFKNLRELTLEWIDAKKIVINNAKLKKIEIGGVKSKKLIIKNAGKVKNIEWGSLQTEELNLSKMKNLKKVDIYPLKAKEIKFGKLSKLKKITIAMHEKAGKNTPTKLDLSGVKNLECFWGVNFTKVKEIKFGKLKKVKEVELYFYNKCNNKLKSLDVSGLKELRYISIDDFKKLKTIKFGNHQKLKCCYTENCKKLKKLNMNGNKVSEIIKVDKWTKVMNLNPVSEKKLKYNE